MQAIALAGSWNVGANINQVVVFRRGDDWHLMATMLDLRAALLGHKPCPADEIWVSDSDLIIVPKSKILLADNFIELVFTNGIYGVFPFSTSYGKRFYFFKSKSTTGVVFFCTAEGFCLYVGAIPTGERGRAQRAGGVSRRIPGSVDNACHWSLTWPQTYVIKPLSNKIALHHIRAG